MGSDAHSGTPEFIYSEIRRTRMAFGEAFCSLMYLHGDRGGRFLSDAALREDGGPLGMCSTFDG
jgi:hypothetical protein